MGLSYKLKIMNYVMALVGFILGSLLLINSCARVPGIANDGDPKKAASTDNSSDASVQEQLNPGIPIDVYCNCHELLSAGERGDYSQLANASEERQAHCTYKVSPEKEQKNRGRLSIEVDRVHSAADFTEASKIAENALNVVEHKANRESYLGGQLFQVSGKNNSIGPLLITISYFPSKKLLIKTEEFKVVNPNEEGQPANFPKTDPSYLQPVIGSYLTACSEK